METERKRKIDECENSASILKKQKKLSDDGSVSKNLLHYFSDEILVEILKKLDSESLFSLSQTCEHFNQLINDKIFWSSADFASVPLSSDEIFKRLKNIGVSTQIVRIQGDCKDKKPKDYSGSDTNCQTFHKIIEIIAEKCPMLHEMYFQYVWFDWIRNFQIQTFPSNLRKMVFINCSLPHKGGRREPKIFSGIDRHLPNLEEIQIDYCNWFEVIDIMQFSKLKNLKKLSLKGSRKFQNCVPYLSLSCKFGFLSLEVLDLRDSNVQDSELHCFNALAKLRELYLEELSTPDDSDDEDDYQFQTTSNNRSSNQNSNDGAGPSTSRPTSTSPETFERCDIINFNGQQIERHTIVNAEPQSHVATIVIRANINNSNNGSNEDFLRLATQNPIVFPPPQPPPLNERLRNVIDFERQFPIYGRSSTSTISDRGLLGFGIPRDQLLNNMVFIRMQQRDPNIYIEKLVARNFKGVTDVTLQHLENCAPRLVYLDITGTSISQQAIENFKITKPECTVISSYD